ncbi:MAG: hypothetical protein ACK4E8_12525 [Lacibacter sp.]|jgi:hypothetical protein
MGRIVKSIILFFSLLLAFNAAEAQKMDTLYIIDYFRRYGAPWSTNSKLFINKGITIHINDSTELLLKASIRDTKLKCKEEGVWFTTLLRLQSLRIIVPENSVLPFHVKAEKIITSRKANFDTVLVFNPKIIRRPYWFIGYVVKDYSSFGFNVKFNYELTNRHFAWKNYYQRPKVRKAILKSVKYEYDWIKGELRTIK